MKKRKRLIQILSGIVVLALLGVWATLSITRPALWLKVWKLDDGTIVKFYREEHDPPGRDDVKLLDIVWPDGKRQSFKFGQTRAGYQKVELRSNQNGNIIWLVDTFDQRVGCSLNLKTDAFFGEMDVHPEAVGINIGRVIE